MNIQSGGGFTAVVVVNLVGTSSGYERIFDFGKFDSADGGTDSITKMWTRGATTNDLTATRVLIWNGAVQVCNVHMNLFMPDEMKTYAVRYDAELNSVEFFRDGTSVGSGARSGVPVDRTMLIVDIGRSNSVSPSFTEMFLKELMVVLEKLTDLQILEIAEILNEGMEACACTGCRAGQYKSELGMHECSNCPAGQNTIIQGSKICQCSAGFS